MPKEEWGVKRICPTTGKRFYDMNNDPIISPYTGEKVLLDDNTKTRVAEAEAQKATDEDDLVVDEADDLLDDDDTADADLGDDLLEDDDDDDVSLDEIADVAAPDDDS